MINISYEQALADTAKATRTKLYDELDFNEDMVGVKLESLVYKAIQFLLQTQIGSENRSTTVSHHGYEIKITLENCPTKQ